jgi:3-methyladenine DNA glycosylase Mpg
MRVLIFGSSRWDDERMVRDRLDDLPRAGLTLITGDNAVGQVASEWASEHGVECELHETDWAQHGRRAGTARNEAMLASDAEMVLMFRMHGKSGGMDSLAASCRKSGMRVEVIRPPAADVATQVQRAIGAAVREDKRVERLQRVIAEAIAALDEGRPRERCLQILRKGVK